MTVVVGIDGSDLSQRVVTRAIEEAERRSTDLHVIHVFHPRMLAVAEVAYDWSALAAAERRAVWNSVAPVLERAPVRYEKVDLEGYPPDTLVDYCKNVSADLLVLGTRGRGDFASFILGSTSHRAAQLAPCDVLIVRPRE